MGLLTTPQAHLPPPTAPRSQEGGAGSRRRRGRHHRRRSLGPARGIAGRCWPGPPCPPTGCGPGSSSSTQQAAPPGRGRLFSIFPQAPRRRRRRPRLLALVHCQLAWRAADRRGRLPEAREAAAHAAQTAARQDQHHAARPGLPGQTEP
ncbi:hypothetical protein LT493_32010 [Streptomyces tricolor]|nr:hypothetical protein [Streptomyces tricolor]